MNTIPLILYYTIYYIYVTVYTFYISHIGAWEKYNNNHGLVTVNPTTQGTNHDVIQAFSHWTYQITNGHIMVVDVQGVFDKARNLFHLTDPALHCKDVLRFGATNLHKGGFDRFFETHVCNTCCAEMGLLKPPPVVAAVVKK